ncbi:hypothetical protein GTO10_02610 [Candidatus Saccharibacteria bacterium]|nr:hypothetical protein [Candidatus Saccharibacteria bacterium]
MEFLSLGPAFWSILVALVLGAVIGAEREFHDKPAGLRTHTLIAIASALFTVLSMSSAFGDGAADPTRIASQVLAGMGFVGAGVIISTRGEVRGVTTAASLWITAAIGMAAGLGEYALAVFTTVAALVVLWGFWLLEKPISPRK